MEEAVIIDAVRTPIGRHCGALKDIRPDDLAALVISAIVQRNQLDTNLVEDVILGCANQAGEDNRNVARMSVLLAELPISVGGVTVNRLCGSGLSAINQACMSIQTGQGEIFIAGGVESMTRAPFVMAKPDNAFPRGNQTIFDTTLGWRFTNKKLAAMHYPYSMGETAENVAARYSISREEQDQFALESQHRYKIAFQSGLFSNEIVPVHLPKTKEQKEMLLSADEHPRLDVTIDDLKRLKPAFRENGTVTAGNSSGINDGAAALLIMSRKKAEKLGYKPVARYVTSAIAGVEPAYMGTGPIPATLKALARAQLTIEQISLIELNEAFAAQVLACQRDLNIPANKLNVNGGSIAIGHPLGCSGARILTTLLYEMRRREAQYGLATMCIGVGQGIATIVERL